MMNPAPPSPPSPCARCDTGRDRRELLREIAAIPQRWQDGEHRFECPRHKSTFKPDGGLVEGRATRNMDRYGIRRESNNVVVDLGKLYREDENLDDWISAVVRL